MSRPPKVGLAKAEPLQAALGAIAAERGAAAAVEIGRAHV